MSDPKRELCRAEDAGWAEFRELIGRLSPSQVLEPGYQDDGSVKDLIAHMGDWMAEAATVLCQIHQRTFTKWEGDVDALNERFRETWNDADLDTVKAHLYSARSRMLDEWNLVTDVDATAIEWFKESGEEHYAEHMPRLREWVEQLTSD